MTISQTQNFQQSQQFQQSPQSQNSTRPWLRVIRVTLGPLEEWRGLAQGEVVRFESNGTPSGLRVECSLQKSIMGMPSPSQIKIYNLAQDTRNAIGAGLTKITVEAGWATSAGATSVGTSSELHIVFQGSIYSVTSQRSGADIVTVISALPGYGALVRGVSSKSYGPGMPLREVVKDMARDLPGLLVSDGGIEGVLGAVGSGGWCFAGSTRDGLTKLAEEFGFSWHVDNGHFKAIGDNSVFGGIFELSSPRSNRAGVSGGGSGNGLGNGLGNGWGKGLGRELGGNVGKNASASTGISTASSFSSDNSGYSKKTSDDTGSRPPDSNGNNGPAGVLKSVMPVVFGPLQNTPGVRIEAQYAPGLVVGATVRINSDESPSLNGDYRVLNAIIRLDTYSDEGWSMEVDARRVRVEVPPAPPELPKNWIELDFRDEENNPVAVKVVISQPDTSPGTSADNSGTGYKEMGIERIIKGPSMFSFLDSNPVSVRVKGKDLYYAAINGNKRAWQGGELKYDEPQKASTLSDTKNPVQVYSKKQMGGPENKTEKEYVLIKTSNTLNPFPPA